jgi:cytochrome c-type biogenesis protein CcmH
VTFTLAAAFLCVLAIGFVLVPVLRKSSAPAGDDQLADDRRAAAIAIVRARLEELDRELREGLLDDTTYQSLKVEQERRLLQDVHALDNNTGVGSAPKVQRLMWVAVVLIPAAAFLLYRHVGGWLDWSIEEAMQTSMAQAEQGLDNRNELEKLVTLFEKRLAARDDDDGRRRFSLAQLLLRLGRTQEALAQFAILLEKFPEDADLAGQYAQALYIAASRQMTPEVKKAAERALALNPDQPTALGMLGIAAFQQKDYVQTLTHWRRLLRQLPPDSPNAKLIAGGIEQAEAALGTTGVPGPKLDVAVTIAPALLQQGGVRGTLFVFARAVNGPPLPLAVARFENPSLPLQVTLDDSMAMAAGMNLSSFKQVQVFARVTASGQVRGEPGDLEGNSAPLDLTDKALPVAVTIDRRL